MADRTKVIKGLECCSESMGEACPMECPYRVECLMQDELNMYSVMYDALELVKKQPEIVRCKDCKYWRSNTQFCELWTVNFQAHHTPPEWFCADGEVKQDG